MYKLFLLLILSVASLSASTINICSDTVTGTNSLTGTNVFITPHPAWSPNGSCGQWISFAATGDGQSSPANTTTGGSPTVTFIEPFTLTAGSYSGSISVWADDTARIRLVNSLYGGSGIVLAAANPVQDGACAAGPIGCEPNEGLTVSLGSYLAPGVNTLYIDAFQVGGGPFGAKYQGAVTTTVPEPYSFALVGAGLAGVWLLRRRTARP